MRNSRIYTAQVLRSGSDIDLDERAARYLLQVLRMRAGQQITLFDGSGRDYTAELLRCDRRECRARVFEPSAEEPPLQLSISLGVGISRGERMDLVIQKSVELGVAEITPLHTQRAIVQLDDARRERRMEHWNGVLIGACEQSGRRRLPRLSAPQTLPDWLDGRPAGILLDHRAETTIKQLAPPTEQPLSLLVGPEGGLDDAERSLALQHGFRGLRLGPRVLRTETAPLAALAVLQTVWGDLG